jgi:hypothetical protein
MMARRILFNLISLLATLVFAAVLWAPFLELIPGVKLDMLGGLARARMLGAGLFVALFIARFLVRPPKEPSRRSVAWGAFAASTGGTVREEMRQLAPMGWTGGTTVRWNSRGTEVTLTTSTDTDGNDFTQFAADVRLSRGFQFHIGPENLLTKVLFSNQLWSIALKAMKQREGQVAARLQFLGEKELLLGEPMLDDAFLVKSDTPALAREFFLDATVSCCLRELNKDGNGWQLSLMSRGPSTEYRLTLSLPGSMLDPQGLEASRSLMEAAIRCFADRGMLASGGSQAA